MSWLQMSIACATLPLCFAGSFVGSGILSGDRLDVKVRAQYGFNQGTRRLAVDQVPKPDSVFSVVDCATIAGLSAQKASTLTSNSFTKCINALGVLVAGNSGLSACGGDNNMLFLANTLAEWIDNNQDGVVDNPTMVAYIDSFSKSTPVPIMVVGCNQAEEAGTDAVTNNVGYIASGQGWKESGVKARAPLIEEAVHFIQQRALGKLEPLYAAVWTSRLGKCTKAAQCTWYMHPENTGCSDIDGNKCVNTEVACTGACTSFNTPGQCYDPGPSGAGCAVDNCDIIEFFNQVLNSYLETPSYQGALGSFYQKVQDSGANTKSGVESKLTASGVDCQAILADFQSGTNLPTNALTGTYQPATTTAAPATSTTTAGDGDGDGDGAGTSTATTTVPAIPTTTAGDGDGDGDGAGTSKATTTAQDIPATSLSPRAQSTVAASLSTLLLVLARMIQ